MAKPGPKKWMPTKEQIAEIEKQSKRGMTLEWIADMWGISYDTLNRRLQDGTCKICESRKRGRATGIKGMLGALFLKGLKGDVGAIRLYMHNVAGWDDKVQHSTEPGHPLEVRQHPPLSKKEALAIKDLLVENLKK